jgi:hypothetical protein
VEDLRVESDWEEFRREWHVDAVVGTLAVAGGIALAIGSGGTLVPLLASAAVAVGAGYGATVSVSNMVDRGTHGQSNNPFTSREAFMDTLNLAGSAMGAGVFSSALRASTSFQRAAFATGLVGTEENIRYAHDYWDQMTPAQQRETAFMTVLNVVDIGTPLYAQPIRARLGNANATNGMPPGAITPRPATDLPSSSTVVADGQLTMPPAITDVTTPRARPVGARPPAGEPVATPPRADPAATQPLPAEGAPPPVREVVALPVREVVAMPRGDGVESGDGASLHARTLAEVERLVRAGHNHEADSFSMQEMVGARRIEHAFGIRLDPSDTIGVDFHGPMRMPDGPSGVRGTDWRNVSLKGPFLRGRDLLPLDDAAQRHAIDRVVSHVRTNTAVTVHVVDRFGLSPENSRAMHDALADPALQALLAQRGQRVWLLSHEMPEGYAQTVGNFVERFRPSARASAEPGGAPRDAGLNLVDQPHRRADLDLLAPNDPARPAPGVSARLPAPADTFVVDAHGTLHGLRDADGNEISAPALADRIRDHSGYRPGRPVLLYVCDAAQGVYPYAQQLASRLGSDVYAATGIVNVYTARGVDAADATIGVGLGRSRLHNSDPRTTDAPEWRRFQPGLPIVQIREGGRTVFDANAAPASSQAPHAGAGRETPSGLPFIHVGERGSGQSSRPGRGRVAAALGAGTLFTGAATAGTYEAAGALPPGSAVSLVAAGLLVRAGVKVARYGDANYWRAQNATMQHHLDGKGRFEHAANQLVARMDDRLLHVGAQEQRALGDARRGLDAAQPGRSKRLEERRVRAATEELIATAQRMDVDANVLAPLARELRDNARAKARFDHALGRHEQVVDRLHRFLHGVPVDRQQELRNEVSALGAADTALRNRNPADDAQALADLRAAMKSLEELGADLRPADSRVRKAVDAMQMATYAGGLGAVVRSAVDGTLPTDQLTLAATGLLAAANAIDAVRLSGIRIDELVGKLPSLNGKPTVAHSRAFERVLSGMDDGLSTLGGAALMELARRNGLDDPGDVARFLGASVYTAGGAAQVVEGARRGWSDPTDSQRTDSQRRAFLTSRVVAGAGAVALAVGTLLDEAYPEVDPKTLQPPTPTPTTQPSDPPPPDVPLDVAPNQPPPTGDGAQPVIATVRRGDSLWKLSSDHIDTLLPQRADDSGTASNREVAQALSQLMRLNPDRGFEPALIDGRPTTAPGDPDLILEGWRLRVG